MKAENLENVEVWNAGYRIMATKVGDKWFVASPEPGRGLGPELKHVTGLYQPEARK